MKRKSRGGAHVNCLKRELLQVGAQDRRQLGSDVSWGATRRTLIRTVAALVVLVISASIVPRGAVAAVYPRDALLNEWSIRPHQDLPRAHERQALLSGAE
jgi:hypothetical protein